MYRWLAVVGIVLLPLRPVFANDPCNCRGYAGPGGPCYARPGGPAYDGPGGPAYTGPGGPCYSGPSGSEYSGPGGPAYDGPGGPRYSGPRGPSYDGPGGPFTTVQVAHVMRVQAVRVIQVLAEEINVLRFAGRNNIRRISEGGGDPKSRLADLDCMGIDERLSWFLYRWKAENQILSASASFALL